MDSKLASDIVYNKDENELLEYAKKNMGFRNLRDIALVKIKNGITTPEEILRVMNT